MKRLYFITAVAVTFFAVTTASGQSNSFKLGKWTEIHNGIVKELNRSYVDSLPVDRIMRAGVDAMLEALDPYTVYIPQEENEDLQMMLSNSYGGIGAIIHKPKGSNVIINEPYAGSPATKAGLVCGDEIIAIDGTLTKDLEIKESTDRMKGKPGTTVVFTVKKARTGDTLDVPVLRERIHLPDVQYAAMLDDTTGYLLLGGFTENVGTEVHRTQEGWNEEICTRPAWKRRRSYGRSCGHPLDLPSKEHPCSNLKGQYCSLNIRVPHNP